jgi:hypothetical protein
MHMHSNNDGWVEEVSSSLQDSNSHAICWLGWVWYRYTIVTFCLLNACFTFAGSQAVQGGLDAG